MKKLTLAPLCLLLAATPAEATGGLVCRTAGSNPVQVALVISHTVVPSVVSARLIDNGRDVPVSVAQSWLEAKEVRLDLEECGRMVNRLRVFRV